MSRAVVMAITKDAASPTEVAYAEFMQAYAFFNRELFNGGLPHCMITFQRGRFRGYYSEKRWDSTKGKVCDEIALNPDYFKHFPFTDVMNTLVHEMVHLWREHFGGERARKRYHDQVWARKMLELGLQPFRFDNPDKMTGQNVYDAIVPGGPFDRAVHKLMESGLRAITWRDTKTARKPDNEIYTTEDLEKYRERFAATQREREEAYALAIAARAERDRRYEAVIAERNRKVALMELEEKARAEAKGKSGERTVYRCPKCKWTVRGSPKGRPWCEGDGDEPHDLERMIRDGIDLPEEQDGVTRADKPSRRPLVLPSSDQHPQATG